MVATGVTAETAAADAQTADAQTAGAAIWRPGEIWRDIARGGLAGIVVGILVAGVGGRLVMRLAALLVPLANGSITENDNVIGAITFQGTMALVIFIGLFFGATAGVIWVVIRTWLPGTGITRALVAGVAAIGLGSFGLIRAGNSDFVVLGFHPVVVASLVALVGMIGVGMSLVDGWLDRRLPVPTSAQSTSALVYAAISLIGGVVFLPVVVAAIFDSEPLLGVGLAVVGVATVVWWSMRLRGETQPSRSLLLVGRMALAISVLIGFVIELPEIRGALGIY